MIHPLRYILQMYIQSFIKAMGFPPILSSLQNLFGLVEYVLYTDLCHETIHLIRKWTDANITYLSSRAIHNNVDTVLTWGIIALMIYSRHETFCSVSQSMAITKKAVAVLKRCLTLSRPTSRYRLLQSKAVEKLWKSDNTFIVSHYLKGRDNDV